MRAPLFAAMVSVGILGSATVAGQETPPSWVDQAITQSALNEGLFELPSAELAPLPPLDRMLATEIEPDLAPVASLTPVPSSSETSSNPPDQADSMASAVVQSIAEIDPDAPSQVRNIPAFVASRSPSARLVQYDVPLEASDIHREFINRGIEGRLIQVVSHEEDSASDRLKGFLNPMAARSKHRQVRVVRYEVPAEQIEFHSRMSAQVEGEILEPGVLRLPEVRFFQPKARIFSDLKSDNDDEFDLFADGAILASLDVVEFYFPMPLVSERFAEAFGKSSRLSSLGWRVGGTIGLGITTAINNDGSDNGSAPVSTLSAGVRYEFPLGRPSRELIETGDARLDQRTRVGIEWGLQGGFSTRESLEDRTDLGLYMGILVNTPWGG